MAPDLLNLLGKLPPLLAILCPLLLGGCLVPLTLDAESAIDGGRLLLITEATKPPFGTQVAMRRDAYFDYTIDVLTDATTLDGRLYAQIDGSCCDLDLDPMKQKIDLLGDAPTVTEVERGHFRIGFLTVRPCYHVPPKSIAYVIPVVATGGFVGGPTDKVQAVGMLSKDHYWSVQCQ